MLVGFGLVAAVSLSFSTFFIFLPSYLSTELGIALPRALAGALLGLAVMVALAPALGRLSDRVGRKPLLAAVTLSLLGLTVPIYLLIRQGGPVGRALGYLLVGVVLSGFVLPSLLAELFPTQMRSSALSITYGVASALFGGSAPLATRCWSSAPATRSSPPGTPPRWPWWRRSGRCGCRRPRSGRWTPTSRRSWRASGRSP
jgi:MHS family proline/betaine transporter-like MFS transporter